MRLARGVLLIALAGLALHFAVNGRYGFHRDELATLDDARRLAWGYVAYPPLTPFFGRISLELFGNSLWGIRLFPALGQFLAALLAGWMAREFGGGRGAQTLSAAAVAIAPISLASGALLQYVSFDVLCWILAACSMARLLRTGEPRWWLAVGAAIGLGMLNKYAMGFLALGIAGAALLTPLRRQFRTPWPWLGTALSIAIMLPNLIWQAQHGWVSLEFLSYIHARDIRIGRTSGFVAEQFFVAANTFTIPLWIAGLRWLFFAREGRGYRAMGWVFAIPVALLALMQGRGYYTAGAYPVLLAAGSVAAESWAARLRPRPLRVAKGAAWAALLCGGALAAAMALPLAPVNSAWWRLVEGNWREEIGWPELVATVAQVRDGLPPEDRARLGILAGNYGEAGAISLYGPRYGLPHAMSGVNSYWYRGYDDPPPSVLIVLGLSGTELDGIFDSCRVAGLITNRYGIGNEESLDHAEIFVCRGMLVPWPEILEAF